VAEQGDAASAKTDSPQDEAHGIEPLVKVSA
jgi:hypothetical protein